MPVLPKYTATVGGVDAGGGRRASAQDFGAPGLGDSGMVGAGHQIQAAAQTFLNDMEERESRAALVQSTQVRADYARRLDEAQRTGANLDPLKQSMLEDLAKIGEKFDTRRGQEQLQLYTANSEIMFDQQANAIAVQRAWTQAKIDGTNFVASASALIQSNPGYLQVAEKNAEDFVATFSKVPAHQRAALAQELKQDLNMAAAISAARMNPADTKKRLEAGEWSLTPEQRNIALNKANAEQEHKLVEQARLREEDRRVKQEAATDALYEYTKGIYTGAFSSRQALDDPRFASHPQFLEHLILAEKQRVKELREREQPSDPIVRHNLWLAIHAPEGTPGKIYTAGPIYEAVKNGKLNLQNANALVSDVANLKDENNRSLGARLTEADHIIGRAVSQYPGFVMQPALVADIQLDYMSRVRAKISALRAAGDKHPMRIFDANDKDYIGSNAFVQSSIDAAQARKAMLAPKAATVNSQAEYDALAPGTPYVDSNGHRGVKAASKQQSSGKIQ